MRPTAGLGPAAGDHFAAGLIDDEGTHRRIGRGGPQDAPGEAERHSHEAAILRRAINAKLGRG